MEPSMQNYSASLKTLVDKKAFAAEVGYNNIAKQFGNFV